MPEDRLERGRTYVKRLRRDGWSDQAIRRSLLASGWAADDAAELLEHTRPRSEPHAISVPPSRVPRAGTWLRAAAAVGLLCALAVIVWIAARPGRTRGERLGSEPTPGDARPGPVAAGPHASSVPRLISPPPGAVMPNGRRDHSVQRVWAFDWSDYPGATRYHL